jgi:hypothetical protein
MNPEAGHLAEYHERTVAPAIVHGRPGRDLRPLEDDVRGQPAPSEAGQERRRLPIKYQLLLALGAMLGLLVVSMLVAIVLVAGLRQGETRLNDRQVPYANAVAEAALNAKGAANDQGGT